MLEFLTLAGLSAGAEHLVKEVLGPLAKAAAEDFCKDFLKQCVSDGLAQAAPEPLKKGIAKSLKAFLVLFQAELENCGLPGELAHHEFAPPLKQLLKDSAVRQFLGAAFATELKQLDGTFLPEKWAQIGAVQLPEDFDWAQLTKNYVRRVKGLIRGDEALARQLELDFQERTEANTAEILGVKVDFDLKAYQESLKERYGRLSLDSLDSTGAAYNDLRLWKIFEPQDVRECAEFAPQMYELPKERLAELKAAGEIEELLSLEAVDQRRRSYAEQPVESVRGVVGLREAASQPRTVILGDPGSGKSTLLQAMALEWAEQAVGALRGKPLPILIELRLYAQDKDGGKCNSFLEYLHQGNTFCRLNQRELQALLKSGEVVALFDGVDEVFDPRLREAVVNDIHRFSNSYPSVQMVVTSRWLGYKAETLRNADFRHYMLQDLNDEQIENFVETWHGLTFGAGQTEERVRKQGRLQKAIAESKPIRELAGNPLLLTMMAILNRNQELPRDRARLYERASEVLLYQWDVERKVHEVPELKNWQIDVRDKQAMLRKVAHHMQANEQGLSGNVISRGDLEQILMDYLKTLEVEQARPVARIMIEQLRERNFILCYLGADSYAFVHRTFLEYFCASELVWKFEKERTLEKEDLKALYGVHFQEEAWNEVLRLIAGMVEPRFVGEIIEYLLSQRVEPVNFIDGDYPCLPKKGLGNLLLAADCLIEVRSRHEISVTENKLLNRLKSEAEHQYPYLLDYEAAETLVKAIVNSSIEETETLAWMKHCLLLNKGELPFTVGRITWTQIPDSVPTAIVKVIADRWKKDPNTLPWLKQLAQEDKDENVHSAAVRALVKEWKNHPDTLPFIKKQAQENKDGYVRSAAVRALAQGWKDHPDTLPFIKKRIQEDKDGSVRRAAVQALAQEWKDEPDTLPFIKKRVQEDRDEYVRSAAVRALVQGWKDHPDTLTWLRKIAQKDKDGYVRGAAIEALCQKLKDAPDTLTWLKKLAQEDKEEYVRSAAVLGLARGWKNDQDTLAILKKLAQEDKDEYVRSVAVLELARGWKDDQDTLDILKKLAQEDKGTQVRSHALKELARGWENDPSLFDIWCTHIRQDYFQRTNDWQYNPRQAALTVLVQQYPTHAKTTALLQDRSQNDNDEQLRDWATKQLKQLNP